jgi:hypothetical protein
MDVYEVMKQHILRTVRIADTRPLLLHVHVTLDVSAEASRAGLRFKKTCWRL